QAHLKAHEVTHGPAVDSHQSSVASHDADAAHDDAHAGHGHGPWHGPHESPAPMTYPLMALAVGALVAGFVGVPAALMGNNAIEHFLEPSFTASAHIEPGAAAATDAVPAEGGAGHEAEAHPSTAVELGLM